MMTTWINTVVVSDHVTLSLKLFPWLVSNTVHSLYLACTEDSFLLWILKQPVTQSAFTGHHSISVLEKNDTIKMLLAVIL
jgi:hypothetical protein